MSEQNPVFLADWKYRGLLNQATHGEELERHLTEDRPVTVYCGFDPTADSLHIGSLLPLLALRRIQLAGHRPVALVGGGTGMIGDPSGKAGERSLNSAEIVQEWTEKLRRQVSRFIDFDCGANSAIVINNYDWLGSITAIELLRDYGKHFSVSSMLAKESVDSRISSGISFTEFTYMILQSVDFLELRRRLDCTIQIGGSDQWGNITTGMDLIRRKLGLDAYGVTMPLVTKSDGRKFGKTETGTVWLDASKTSPYAMYQFWLSTTDADVIRFLKLFTFLSAAEIDALEAATQSAPEAREAQRVLAREVTSLVHGAAAVEDAERVTRAFFSEGVAGLTERDWQDLAADAPTTTINGTSTSLIDALVSSGLAPSKSRARELIESGGVAVNDAKVRDPKTLVEQSAAFHGRYAVIRKGRKDRHILIFATE
ncbi:MAG TPA: tyrosine--tRNA ligase [Thermoanaerobaculia bacterium]|nr:tyrosine--tRNA ligase [Thermoanaerobaculia bacterium]